LELRLEIPYVAYENQRIMLHDKNMIFDLLKNGSREPEEK